MPNHVAGFFAAAAALLSTASTHAASEREGFSGRWEVTTEYPGGNFVAGLTLTADANTYKGNSGYLIPDSYWYKYTGTLRSDGLHLQILAPDEKTPIGYIVLKLREHSLAGDGVIHDVTVKLTGRRPAQRPANAPRVHNFQPQAYYLTFSAANPPALRIFPGDTVRTSTLDAAGGGATSAQHGVPGNPQTGPFYIEGAMIGDTIAVHFTKIQPNRDTAFQNRAALNQNVVPSGYQQRPTDGWSNLWKLDREHGTAIPVDPSDKLKKYTVKLTPMLGCVGVAPWWKQAITTSDLGPFGGNLDYNQITEGTTLYMPVYQAGALLSIGDGHALQADGEITGQGLETSMDVEFTVDLLKDQLLDQPWAENDTYVMVSGIGGSLTQALQNATAGLSNWLHSYYQLNTSEVATLLANAIHYDIAEVTDPEAHVAAKIRKDVLAQLPKPSSPATVFCQPSWGCATN